MRFGIEVKRTTGQITRKVGPNRPRWSNRLAGLSPTLFPPASPFFQNQKKALLSTIAPPEAFTTPTIRQSGAGRNYMKSQKKRGEKRHSEKRKLALFLVCLQWFLSCPFITTRDHTPTILTMKKELPTTLIRNNLPLSWSHDSVTTQNYLPIKKELLKFYWTT